MTYGFLPLHVFLDMEGNLHGAWAAQWWMLCERALINPVLRGSAKPVNKRIWEWKP